MLKHPVNVCTRDVFPGTTLTCLQTDKFKTGVFSIYLISKLSRESAASTALLPLVLRRGTSELPDMECIAAVLDELYGTRIEPLVRKKGELHCIGFYADFPDDRYIPGGESLLEKVIELAGDMLLSPDTRDGLLREDYIESEKSNLIDDIRAAINDKRGYSIDSLISEMCHEEDYGVNRLGSEESACIITRESLTAHYRHLLANSRIEAFYCGGAEPERVESALRAALGGLPERDDIAIPETRIVLYPAGDSPRRFTQAHDVSQGQLAVGFRMGKAMKTCPDYPAMMVFNAVYGWGETSKLFLNVRERLSLCYYAGSMMDTHKGVMIVSSGVGLSNLEAALAEILAQLDNVKKGDVGDNEFLTAKQAVVTALKLALDSPGGLLNRYFDSRIASVPYDPIELLDKVEAVTIGRVVDTASEIQPDSIFFLTGKEGGCV